jgi:hypothetical protein
MRQRLARLAVGLAIAAMPLGVAAQRGYLDRLRNYSLSNIPYDGRFTVARIRYSGYVGWSFDYPEMEQNLTMVLQGITSMHPHTDGSNILTLDDPELMKYPVAYISEPGYWYPSDSEVQGLRTYLNKGAFLIVDDFHFPEEWAVFDIAMHRVLPGARIERLNVKHPIFNTFFSIESLKVPYPGMLGERGLYGEFYGIFEDNDPTRRLMVVIDYNMDIGDYMEWSATGAYAIAPTNEAYKFMINYIVYGLTR